MERLQKFIARCGIASRRKAEQMILEGRVSVNGVVIKEMGVKVSNNDIIMVDNQPISLKDYIYIVMNKPRGVICSNNDEKNRKTIISLLPESIREYNVFTVGRLDYDTKGVILLTNDGDFMNMLVGPKSCVEKEYLARVEGIVTKEKVYELINGVNIGGYITKKCKSFIQSVDVKNNSTLMSIIITEGKYHQVKLMFEKIGHPVKRLTRIRFGEITAEGLAEGECRNLTPHEIKKMYLYK